MDQATWVSNSTCMCDITGVNIGHVVAATNFLSICLHMCKLTFMYKDNISYKFSSKNTYTFSTMPRCVLWIQFYYKTILSTQIDKYNYACHHKIAIVLLGNLACHVIKPFTNNNPVNDSLWFKSEIQFCFD